MVKVMEQWRMRMVTHVGAWAGREDVWWWPQPMEM